MFNFAIKYKLQSAFCRELKCMCDLIFFKLNYVFHLCTKRKFKKINNGFLLRNVHATTHKVTLCLIIIKLINNLQEKITYRCDYSDILFLTELLPGLLNAEGKRKY